MTEQEAMIRFDFIRCALLGGTKPEIIPNEDNVELMDIAIKALEEVTQYRAIGTVVDIKSNMEELKRWRTDKTNLNISNVKQWFQFLYIKVLKKNVKNVTF